MTVTPGGPFVVTGSDVHTLLATTTDGKYKKTLYKTTNTIIDVAVSPTGRWVVLERTTDPIPAYNETFSVVTGGVGLATRTVASRSYAACMRDVAVSADSRIVAWDENGQMTQGPNGTWYCQNTKQVRAMTLSTGVEVMWETTGNMAVTVTDFVDDDPRFAWLDLQSNYSQWYKLNLVNGLPYQASAPPARNAALSPDGTHNAYVGNSPGVPDLFVEDLNGNTRDYGQVVVSCENTAVGWLDNQTVLVDCGSTGGADGYHPFHAVVRITDGKVLSTPVGPVYGFTR
ncbi:hypothetical protein ABZ876_30725 [Streptomyces sp. NPDC046931]|uniref:hypothetical protein n=1 Tax=Streptomyces sp. NPDC046931 TaxID=3154806 RepID=UPI0033FDD2F4